MEMKKVYKRIKETAGKYKYAIFVLILGLILLCLPEKSTSKIENNRVSREIKAELTTEEALTNILGCISGAGNVKVMLTKAKDEETIYQEDRNESTDDKNTEVNLKTVIVSDNQRNQTGLIRTVNPPAYRGAIVVCSGADNPAVKLAIVDAVSKVTGLGANQISVLKMK